ncbi:hypothetical protein J7M00_06515 [bacterium]|nr:hypothetical protein [bacterium]
MKNFFAISSILLPIVVFGQMWSGGAGDSVYIKISVRMVGVSWSIDTLADGWDDDSDTLPTWHYTSSSEYDSFWTDAGELDVCQKLIASYWLENTGGISLDIMVRADIRAEDTTEIPWSWSPDSFTCAGIDSEGIANQAGLAVVAMIADGIVDDFMPAFITSSDIPYTWWDEIDEDSYFPTPTWRKYPYVNATGTNLLASDPAIMPDVDGTYRRENDQMELYLYVLCPPHPTTSSAQTIMFWVTAKITD